MLLSWIWLVIILFSVISGIFSGNSSAVSQGALEGTQTGIRLALDLAGPLCLWSGVCAAMDKGGITSCLSRLLRPVLRRLFPSSRTDAVLENALSTNICANILGLGNAATPMGIQAVKRMAGPTHATVATDQMCRLVVLNTASIQLIPATVAAVRSSLGCAAPLDILPAVWITSLSSAGMGLAAAWILGKLWH